MCATVEMALNIPFRGNFNETTPSQTVKSGIGTKILIPFIKTELFNDYVKTNPS